MAKPQLSLRMLLYTVAGVAIVVTILIELDGRIEDLAANGYRVQAAGDLLVEYMKDRGKWPKNWDDLERFVEENKTRLRYAPDVRNLQTYVRIDFDFDPSTVDLEAEWSDHKPLFVVVSSVYGRTDGATGNPNHYIFTYLRGDVP